MMGNYDSLDKALITKNLSDLYIDDVLIFSKIDSTNEFCKTLYNKGVDRTLIVASNEQSKGRGRKGREFLSPKNGLYFSILCQELSLDINQLPFATICAVLAVCQAIEMFYEITLDIKWLNDVYLNGKKVAGILTETKLKGSNCEFIIVGFGINTKDVPVLSDGQGRITSIEKETGITINRNEIISEICNQFFDYCCMIKENDFSFLREYKKRNFLIGKYVYLTENPNVAYKALKINEQGKLVIQHQEQTRVLNAEEISICDWKPGNAQR